MNSDSEVAPHRKKRGRRRYGYRVMHDLEKTWRWGVRFGPFENWYHTERAREEAISALEKSQLADAWPGKYLDLSTLERVER